MDSSISIDTATSITELTQIVMRYDLFALSTVSEKTDVSSSDSAMGRPVAAFLLVLGIDRIALGESASHTYHIS